MQSVSSSSAGRSRGGCRQLDSLVAQLGQTEPHYIKCIKPNSAKSPGGWSSPLVIEQLRYSGVLEVSRRRAFAWPSFVMHYGRLRSVDYLFFCSPTWGAGGASRI